MNELVNNIKENTHLLINGVDYLVKTKTWYSIEEDSSASYVKCELSNNRVLVIIPDDELLYIGRIVNDMGYERLSDDSIKYNNQVFNKTGDGHQYIKNIEFGDLEEVEGKCTFEDYESGNNIISLGILTEKDNIRADVLALILDINDVKVL